MASYYYLIASLPDLKSDGEMPITYQQFLDMCENTVSAKTYQALKDLDLSNEEGPVVKEWSKSYGALTQELNYQRSQRLGKSYPTPQVKEFTTTQVVSNAIAAKNPLEGEKIMLEYQFQLLDSIVGLHMFDDYVLFGYAIKLKLLERQACFHRDKGEAEFRRLMDLVQQRVYSL
jgi:hypothetical protein